MSDAPTESVESTGEYEGYFGQKTDAFGSVIDRLEAHRAVTVDDFWGEWLVRYGGTVYRTDAEY